MEVQTTHKLSAAGASAIVASGMIGSGIYLIPAGLAPFGSISILGWLLAITGGLLMAGVFSGLAILKPSSDGLFAVIGEAFGPGAGFIAGALYWNPLSVAPIALAVTGYLSFFYPILGRLPGSIVCDLIVVWLVIGINLLGPRMVARLSGTVLTFGLIPIVLVALGGWLYFKPQLFLTAWNPMHLAPWTAATRVAVPAFWIFLGLEYAIVLAPLTRKPERDVPIANFVGVGLTAGLSLAACMVILGLIPVARLAQSNAPFADAAAPWVGLWIAGVVAACAMFKSAGALASGNLALADAGDSPAVRGFLFGRVRQVGAGPSRLGLVVMGALTCFAIIVSADPSLAKQFTTMTDIVVVLYMGVYIAACAALWRFAALARRRFFWRLAALAGGAFCLAMICSAESDLLRWSGAMAGFVVLVFFAVFGLRWVTGRSPAA